VGVSVALPQVVLRLLEVETVALVAVHEDGQSTMLLPGFLLRRASATLDEEEGIAIQLFVPNRTISCVLLDCFCSRLALRPV
jgi:hypothetical protein